MQSAPGSALWWVFHQFEEKQLRQSNSALIVGDRPMVLVTVVVVVILLLVTT